MMTADLGACEWFVWDLRRSNLVERGRLEQIVSEYMMRHPNAEPAELASYLVEQEVLTRFQADSLLNGKSQGLVLGPFIVHDVLGTGTMGTVYKAMSKINNEWYAVKVLPRRSMWNIRLARRKVRDFEQFQHPAVIPFVDVGTSGAMHYLAWPLVEGEPLNKIVERDGRLNAAQTALYAMLTSEGLESCHQRNIIHGLLKPSNIMITPDHQVKILDFGVGSLLRETEGESVVDTMSTANTMAAGLDCASPESIMDPTTTSFASDQYSLGCIMYYCLTGNYPFPGNNAVEKMMAHQSKQPPPIKETAPETPNELIAVIERLMQKRPEDRYPSISDVIVTLRPMVMQPSLTPQGSSGTKLSGLRAIPEALRRAGPVSPGSLKSAPKAEAPPQESARQPMARPQPTPMPPLPDRQSLHKPASATPNAPAPGGAMYASGEQPVMNNMGMTPQTLRMTSREMAEENIRVAMQQPQYMQPMYGQPAALSGKTILILVLAMLFSLIIGMGGMFAIIWFFVLNKATQ